MAEHIQHMRVNNPGSDSHLIVIDDEFLFEILRQHKTLTGRETAVGAAFSNCYLKQTPHAAYYLLYQEPGNAHLHLCLALSVLAKHARFKTVIALGKGLTLSNSLSNDHPVLIKEARACPYPALYQNENPYSIEKQQVEIYKPAPLPDERIAANLKGQNPLQAIAGYCKHPVHNGGLLPWAPEQFKQLSNQGVQVYSEVPAGIYDAGETPAFNQTTMLAFCVMTKTLDDQHPNPIKLADWLVDTQQQLAQSKSTGSTSTIN